jgi:hypothetical protein
VHLIDRKAIANLSVAQREGYAVTLILLTGIPLFVLYLFGGIIFDEYKLDKRYELEGIRAEGEVTSFRYYQGKGKNPERFTGYYPNVTFTTPNGPVTIEASFGEPVTAEKQQGLLGWKLNVAYLPEQPERGRVITWHHTFASGAWPLLLLCAVSTILVFYYAYVMWPHRRKEPNL